MNVETRRIEPRKYILPCSLFWPSCSWHPFDVTQAKHDPPVHCLRSHDRVDRQHHLGGFRFELGIVFAVVTVGEIGYRACAESQWWVNSPARTNNMGQARSILDLQSQGTECPGHTHQTCWTRYALTAAVPPKACLITPVESRPSTSPLWGASAAMHNKRR